MRNEVNNSCTVVWNIFSKVDSQQLAVHVEQSETGFNLWHSGRCLPSSPNRCLAGESKEEVGVQKQFIGAAVPK